MPLDIKEFKANIKSAKDKSRAWRKEAKECYDFVAGRQWTEEEEAILKEQLRPIVSFNRIAKIIDSVSGHQIVNRQEVKYYQREQGDAQLAEILTAAGEWVDDECEANDEVSDAFMDMIIGGMGWTETRMSYDEDPDGKVISAERFSPFEALWDPVSMKRNLGDTKWRSRSRWWPRKEAEQDWPKLKDVDLTNGVSEDPWDETDEPVDVTESIFYKDNISDWYNSKKDQILIHFYQWWELQTIFRVGDPQSGRLVELSSAKFSRILQDQGNGTALLPGGQPVRYVRQKKRKYYYAFVAGDTVLEEGDIPCSHFTLLAMCAKHDQTKNVWYGMVRSLLDPQRWANKFFSTIQDIMMSNRQGGAFAETDAFDDPSQAEEDWNDPSALIWLKPGSLQKGKIQERDAIQYPAGMDRLMNIAIEAIPDTSGINMELMGLVDRNQPGILEAQRKQAGMTILARMFDSLRRYQKTRGKVVMYFIREYISDGRLVRVLGNSGQAQYLPLLKDETIGTYDIIVDEAPTSTNQKEQVWGILSQLIPFAKGAGWPIPPQVVKYLPLPESLIEEWMKMVQPNPEAQKQQQIQEEAQIAQIENTKADTAKKQADAGLAAAKIPAQEIEARSNLVNLATGGK